MKKRKKWMAAFVVAAVLLLGSAAYAKTYRGEAFSVEIPQGDTVYYYTPDDTNMSGEMLESAQQESEILLLTGVYEETGEGNLQYSLKIEAEDIAEGTAETEAATQRIEALIEEQAGQYTFGEIAEDTLGGVDASTVEGGRTDYDGYRETLWTLVYGGKVYTVTLLYAAEGEALGLAEKQLATFAMGVPQASATPMATPEQTPAVTPAPATMEPKAQATSLETELAPEEPKKSGLDSLVIGGLEIPYLWLIAGGAAMAAAIVFVLLRVKSKRQEEERRRARQEAYEELQTRRGMENAERGYRRQELTADWGQALGYRKDGIEFTRGYTNGYTAGYGNIPAAGYDLQNGLRKAYLLMEQGNYIMAAKMYHECASESTDSSIRNAAELRTVECLKLAGEYDAAYIKAKQLLLKDYGYTEEEKARLLKDVEELGNRPVGDDNQWNRLKRS